MNRVLLSLIWLPLSLMGQPDSVLVEEFNPVDSSWEDLSLWRYSYQDSLLIELKGYGRRTGQTGRRVLWTRTIYTYNGASDTLEIIKLRRRGGESELKMVERREFNREDESVVRYQDFYYENGSGSSGAFYWRHYSGEELTYVYRLSYIAFYNRWDGMLKQFDYDAEGRLISIGFCHSDDSITCLNGNHRYITISYTDTVIDQLTTYRTTISGYEKDRLVRYLDSNGNVLREVATTFHEYAGWLPKWDYIFEYDDEGRVKHKYSYFQGSSNPSRRETYYYTDPPPPLLNRGIVFPNPTRDYFTLELLETARGQVQVIDALGRVVFSSNISSDRLEINATSWDEGCYILRLLSDERTKVWRVIKD
ncbi:T9SS type A sorting domain-containing protein [Phaeocystidibacter luteus]|uniref:T9SS type A sorting domain-containing protein n=1 Tax=Phaeocystidibacter luteus TaxID=911197 RepID=A0A6N6RIW8_9FLAO|nr:T9SS type A sorting domain-containing protein [Phaeocystidibacter luteus]KAB2813916.1 T9SS type A sorting domain-containing protein [Phaeocystidibacter luteus]